MSGDVMRPCLECGEPTANSRCDTCEQTHKRPSDAKSRPSQSVGYDSTWAALSKRARRLQPWCSTCGATEDLTCDHTPTAWQRKAQGKAIRLRDVDVLCRACNSRKGAARQARGDTPHHPPASPPPVVENRSHTPGGYAR